MPEKKPGKVGGKKDGQDKSRGNVPGPGFQRHGLGPGGYCICPNCGKQSPHQEGVPCYELICPGCGANMTRG